MKKYVNNPGEAEEIDGEQTIRRAFSGTIVKGIDTEKRQIEFIISTAGIDRMGDIIEVNGWDLKSYKKNPVVLFGHLSSIPPIGKAIKTWKDGDALRSIAEFMPEDMSAFAHSIFRMYQEKFLNAVSVGFRPLKWERITDEDGNETWSFRFQKQELLEFSAVPIPANPEALIAARQKGIDTMPFKAWAEEMLDNWSETKKPLDLLYGVDRKSIELIRRRAAGAGKTFHLSPDRQDEIMKRNLEAVRAAKAKKVKEHEDVTILGTELKLPVIDEKRLKEVGDVQISEDEIDGVRTFTIDKADETALFSKEIVEDSDDNFVEVEIVEEDEEKDLILRMKATDNSVIEYDLIGVTKDGKFYGMKVKEEESTDDEEKSWTPESVIKAGKDKTLDREGLIKALKSLSEEDLAAALAGLQDAEVVDLTEEDLEDVDDDASDDASNDANDDKSADDDNEEKGKEPKSSDDDEDDDKAGMDDDEDDDDKKSSKQSKEKSVKSDDEEDDDMDFPTTLLFMEDVLVKFEETLDNHDEKAQTRREQRRLEFLAGYMRDLADRLDGGHKDNNKTTTSQRKSKDADTIPEEDAENYVKDIVNSIAPHLTEMVQSKVSKMKGRLD